MAEARRNKKGVRLPEDLGLGEKVIEENRTRFINRDGSFNVHRKGMFKRGSFSPYHAVLNASWPEFFSWILLTYVLINSVFTSFYLLSGPQAFPQLVTTAPTEKVERLFFFSVQAVTTLGSGTLHPATVLAEGLLGLEAMIGMMGFALGAALMFARLSNPAVRIIFSKKAIIAPYKGATAFMFRIVNGRSNELVEMSSTITLSMLDKSGKRSFHQLPLERGTVSVFPLSWTVVHPINKESALYGMSVTDLEKAHAEFLISITATDQDLSKKVYARHSYLYDEVLSGVTFTNILERTADGTVVVDPHRIHETEKAV